jgi:hypothetical protein
MADTLQSAVDLTGKKVSLSVKLDPPLVTDISQPIFISARFFDENTNQNFEEVMYRIFFQKNGTEIPVVTESGQFAGSDSSMTLKATCKYG